VREYQYGDDVRNIDWNVSARMNHLFVKEYIEERELSIVLMIDMSGSTDFGSRSRTKGDVILEAVTLLLYLAQMNNDRISVALFTDRVEAFFQPRKGRKFILKVLDEILAFRPGSRRTSITSAVEFVSRVMKKRSVILLFSDFLDEDPALFTRMKLLGRRHDLIPVRVQDPMEEQMSFYGLTEFVDLETREATLREVDPRPLNLPILAGFNTLSLSTDRPVEQDLLKFFEKRNRMQRHHG
jgi:uncharacterized protein (DUF58 family)